MPKTIEEEIRDAEVAEEAPVVIEETKLDVEMSPTQLKSAGHRYIYDTQTGERSLCHRNNLVRALQKKRPDGSLVFTTSKPRITPKRGVLRCMLHPDERKAEYDAWQFPNCRKSNLTNPFQVRRHMEKRHKEEWKTIKEEETRAEKEAERKLRESLIKLGSKK